MKERDIFVAALAIADPDERDAFLTKACSDAAQREHLRALLDAEPGLGTFLESPARPAASTGVDVGPGSVIGPYKLLEEIGEGGMGVVFMAEQTHTVRRRVALKVIKPGMDSRQVIARFEAERQALAMMEHPNIARVLDAGSTDSGRPYFVMELVRGVPITEYCDVNRLDAEHRLELFVTVCRAIQHAHQKGIIHRDIKPSNVMVTLQDGRPVAKVIDFGIAKAIEQKLTEKTLFTAYGQMIGTPAYMSPEQAEMGEVDVDTRSDIYSLGVLLYELLTGTTPIEATRLRTAGFSEIQRLIREQSPPRPSSRLSTLGAAATILAGNRGTDPGRLARFLAGDLDWIMMKALEKDRTRRYATAGDFAADVERFLRREAVVARPPSTMYRLATFARRHRVAVMAATAVMLALVAGTAVATWQAVAAHRAKRDAQAAAKAEGAAKRTAQAKEAETRAVLTFLEDHILAAARPKNRDGGLGPEVTLRAAIEAAVPSVETGFKDQPLTEARLRLTLGNTFLYLGAATAAAAQFEPARAIYTKFLGPDHPDTINCVIQLGTSFRVQGRARESVELQREILPIARARLGSDALQTLECMNCIGLCLYELHEDEQAVRVHQEVLAIKKAKYGPDDRRTLGTMTNLASAYFAQVRLDDALELRRETVERYRAIGVLDDSGALIAMHNLADSLRGLGRYEEALRLDEETRARRTVLLGAAHPETLLSLWTTAHDLIGLRRGADAVPLIDECLERAVGKHIHWNFRGAAHLRLQYFQRAKDAEQCRRTAELWEKQRRTDGLSLYEAGACRAVTAAVLREKDRTPEGEARSNEEADRAMAWLRQAVAAGFRDGDRLAWGEEFKALRERADFRELIAGLEAKPKEAKPK
jgi:serine/threonine protein kinase/tetratricopeptide (TPR) repeat protein